MPRIHVSSLARLPEVVRETGAQHIVTLINDGTPVVRPVSVLARDHLTISVNDIIMPKDGMIHPARAHVETLLDFVRRWPRQAPLVVHCYAGISRSTAGAFTAVCALRPDRDPRLVAEAIRAQSISAWPNRAIVTLADEVLGRKGAMIRAVEAIGPGRALDQGEPIVLDLD